MNQIGFRVNFIRLCPVFVLKNDNSDKHWDTKKRYRKKKKKKKKENERRQEKT